MSGQSTATPANQPIAKAPTIDTSGVQPADIIVTRSDSTGSKVIRYGSCASYSHAILALDNGECIEAMPNSGVQKLLLSRALKKSSHATLLRHVSIDPNYAAWICHFAEQQSGKPYDKLGAARAGVSTGCKQINNSVSGFFVQVTDELTKKGIHDESFFCSELIVYAFYKGCLPIIRGGYQTATPGAVATSPYLTKIKDVVTV